MIRWKDDQRFVRVLRGRQNKIFSIWKNHTYYTLFQDSPVDLAHFRTFLTGRFQHIM